MSEELNRSKRLIAAAQRDQRIEELLALLPQGHGSGLDADMVDGQHAVELLAKMRGGFGGGGSGGGPHAESHQPGGADDLLGKIAGTLLPTTTLISDIGSVLKKWRYIRSKYFSVDGDGAVASVSLTCNALLTEPITCTNITPVDDAANDLADVWGGKRFRNLGLSLYLLLGKIAVLPAASATYRGKTVRVEGAEGVADKLYCCMKADDDSYSWVQVAIG